MNKDEGLTEIQFIIKEFKFTGWMMNKEEGFDKFNL